MTPRSLRADLLLALSLLLMAVSVYEAVRVGSDPAAAWFSATVLDLATGIEHPPPREPFALRLLLACCGVLTSFAMLPFSGAWSRLVRVTDSWMP